MMNEYEKRIVDDIETVQTGCYSDISNLHEYPTEVACQILLKLVEWACKPQNTTTIMLARQKIDEINKAWLKNVFTNTVKKCIDFSDEWEYRRLLELVMDTIPELRVEVLELCKGSDNDEILEVVADYKNIL